jgi:hypothetical protein
MVLSRGFSYLASRDMLTTAAGCLDDLRDETLPELCSGVALDGQAGDGINSLPLLLVAIARVRQTGISVSGSDFSTAIAAPVRDYTGKVIAAINVSAPDFIMGTPGVRDHLTDCLMRTAQTISGGRGWPGDD